MKWRFRRHGTAGSRPSAFTLHSLFGLTLSLLVLCVCGTGTLAVVSDELEWVMSPPFRASATDHRVSWGTQYAAARAAFPTYHLSYIEAGDEPYLATRIFATSPAGETRVIYVDPATGKVNGASGFLTVRSFMRGLHYYLFTPGDWGFYVVTSLGFLLCGSVMTGLAVYKKFWRGCFRLPRMDRGARVFWGNLHKLLGLWSLWFVLIIALTGVWYCVERVLYRLNVELESPHTVIPAHELAVLGPQPPQRWPLDALVVRAQEALPGLDVKSIELPSAPQQPVVIRGQAAAWLVRDRTNGVALNPYTGAVLSVHRAEHMSVLERWVHTADPLHFGDFGGLWSKLLWVLCGLVMCGLAGTGALVYAKRTAQALTTLRRASFMAARPAVTRIVRLQVLDFLGRWKWPNVLAVSVVPVVCFLWSWQPNVAPEPFGTTILGPERVGPWLVVIGTDTRLPLAPGADVRWRVRFCSGCYEQCRKADLALGDVHHPLWSASPLEGDPYQLSATLRIPRALPQAGLYLWLSIEAWDGQRHTVSWPVSFRSTRRQ